MLAKLFLTVLIVGMTGEAWAMQSTRTTTYFSPEIFSNHSVRKVEISSFPDCSMVDDFTPCQEVYPGGIVIYNGGRKNPSLKPKPVKINWGPCTEWGYENTKFKKFDCSYAVLTKNTSEYNFLTIDVHCTCQIGFGSDGKVYWRDPRKEKK